MNRVLVCGGRDFTDQARAYAVLDHYHQGNPFSVLIHGAARGADTLAGQWAQSRGIPVEVYPADWLAEPRRAGHIRNGKMLKDGKPTVVIAFPGGRGTDNMMMQARYSNVPVLRVPM